MAYGMTVHVRVIKEQCLKIRETGIMDDTTKDMIHNHLDGFFDPSGFPNMEKFRRLEGIVNPGFLPNADGSTSYGIRIIGTKFRIMK